MKERKIKFIIEAMKWRDRINGNTYFSAQITRTSDNQRLRVPFQGGYGDHYYFESLRTMATAGWIPEKYKGHEYAYERENGYPIYRTCRNGLKREVKVWGEQ
jgi:hypothetical protein